MCAAEKGHNTEYAELYLFKSESKMQRPPAPIVSAGGANTAPHHLSFIYSCLSPLPPPLLVTSQPVASSCTLVRYYACVLLDLIAPSNTRSIAQEDVRDTPRDRRGLYATCTSSNLSNLHLVCVLCTRAITLPAIPAWPSIHDIAFVD